MYFGTRLKMQQKAGSFDECEFKCVLAQVLGTSRRVYLDQWWINKLLPDRSSRPRLLNTALGN